MQGLRLGLFLLLAAGLLLTAGQASASGDKRVIKIGQDVTIEAGTKVRSVATLGGQVTVSGTVEKGIVAFGGSVVLTGTAVVGGNVSAVGGVIVMARDAEVGGSLTEINSSNLYETLATALSSEWEGWSWVFAVISLSIFLVILMLGLLTAALLPKPVRTVSEAISESTFKVVLWGILGLVTIAPLTLLLTISVVGIALIPLQMIIMVCAVFLGFIAVGQRLGRAVLKLVKRPVAGPVRETFWGLIILWVIGWLPYIGWMVKAVAIVLGLGAALATRFGTYRGWQCLPCAPAAEAAPTRLVADAQSGPIPGGAASVPVGSADTSPRGDVPSPPAAESAP